METTHPLLVWHLARFLAFLSPWPHSITGLMILMRSHVWERIQLMELLSFHGTAGRLPRVVATAGHACSVEDLIIARYASFCFSET